jgi:hypothetical protein
MIGMVAKTTASNGNFSVPVSGMQTGDIVYCSDGCNDPSFQAGQTAVVQAPPVAPLLSPQMIIVLVAVLAMVGLIGLARLRLNG